MVQVNGKLRSRITVLGGGDSRGSGTGGPPGCQDAGFYCRQDDQEDRGGAGQTRQHRGVKKATDRLKSLVHCVSGQKMKIQSIVILLLTLSVPSRFVRLSFYRRGAGASSRLAQVWPSRSLRTTPRNPIWEAFLPALCGGSSSPKASFRWCRWIRLKPIFRGRITSIYTSAVAHREAEETIQNRLYVTLEIRCVDVRDGKVLWQDPQFTYYQVFLQNADPNISFANRRATLDYPAPEKCRSAFMTAF